MEKAINNLVFLNPPGVLEIILFLLFALVVLYGSYRSTRFLSDPKKKYALIALHIVSFLLITFILLNPALRKESYKEDKKNLALVVDSSFSMELSGDEDGNTRIEKVRAYLDNNQEFLEEIEENYIVRYYTFDETLEPSSRESIFLEEPYGKHTDFRNLIRGLKEKSDSGEADLAIVISDGGKEGEAPSGIVEEIGDAGLQISSISPTAGTAENDVWIDEIDASEVTFLRYPFPVEIVVKTNGQDGIDLPVSLYQDNRLISIKEVSVSSETKEGRVSFEINPISLGRKIYTVSIPQVSGDRIKENNEKSFFTDVIINKIRVLHVAGSPSWDVRFMRKSLKRNPNIDLVSFFILRDPSDLVFASENDLSLIPFPVNEIFGSELQTFDVVIFQNFNFQPYGIFGFHLRSLKDYITEDGGAFLMVGGNKSFGSGNYGRTPISDVLPVELDYLPRTISDAISDEAYKPVLTQAGENHPIMRIIPNKDENERYWENMPELEGLNIVNGIDPTAVTLLKTPEGEPLLAVGEVESGKVAAFLSDSSWRWNFVRASEGDISPHYGKFWNRLFLWFVNDPELRNVRVSTDKAIYNPGESAKIEIRRSETGAGDVSTGASMSLPGGEEADIGMEKQAESRYTGEMRVTEYGNYNVSADFEEGYDLFSDTDVAGVSFRVEPAENEVRGPTANEELLKSLADNTGGKYITTEDSPKKLDIDNRKKRTITGYETVKLWDSPVFFLLLVGLMSGEWFLRRRWGLK
jgi:uncharacterized membrane protein